MHAWLYAQGTPGRTRPRYTLNVWLTRDPAKGGGALQSISVVPATWATVTVSPTGGLAPTTSAGHSADEPVQLSAGSQGAACGRLTVEEGSNASAGQALLVPLQLS